MPPLYSKRRVSTRRAVDIYLIQDRSSQCLRERAGSNIFIHTGLLIRAEDPLQVIGVTRPRNRPYCQAATSSAAMQEV